MQTNIEHKEMNNKDRVKQRKPAVLKIKFLNFWCNLSVFVLLESNSPTD